MAHYPPGPYRERFSKAARDIAESNGAMAGAEKIIKKTLEHGPNWRPGGGKADGYVGMFLGSELGITVAAQAVHCPQCGHGSYTIRYTREARWFRCKSCSHEWQES